MPYRKRDIEERGEPTGGEGIVGDLVRQFADPYAFFRELVQNAIDAGSADIRVDIARDGDGSLLISLRDAGEGMDRETMETKLLVLFRSGKEGVAGKIGKFGIGFVSVLAIGPTVVKVQSTRGGKGHTLHLYADHSYELFEHGGTRAGTTVTLVVPVPPKDAEVRVKEHVQRSRTALRRWCEHAQLPITLHVDESAFGDGRAERIDRALQLDDSLCVARTDTSDGRTSILVGLSGRDGQRAAFYNRGLLLAETEEDLGFRGLVLKVQDAELGHTLSRDNVRRDERFAHALAVARSVVEGGLRRAVQEALKAACGDRQGYFGLAQAVAYTTLDVSGFPLPLLDGEEGTPRRAPGRALAWRPGVLRGAREHGAMVAFLARRGDAVVDLGALPEGYVQRLREARVRIDESWMAELSSVDLVDAAPGSSDAQLLSHVGAALRDTYRDPRAVVLGVVHGAHSQRVCVGQPDDGGRAEDPFSLLPFWRAPLVLNVNHSLVAAAREHAKTSPRFGADMLSRAVLETHGALSPRRSERLLEATLRELLEPAGEAPRGGT